MTTTTAKPLTKSKLKAVAPKMAAPSKPKIVIYGKPGVGKTWASLDFPSVYYIDTEGGADLAHYQDKLENAGGVYLGPNEGSLSFSTIIEQVSALATEPHDHKTLVIDSISKVFNNEVAAEAARLKKAGIKNEYGADRKPAVGYMRELVSWLQRIDMNVVLIAHSRDEYGLNKDGERQIIGETFDCWDRLEYELHLCLHITKAGASRYARVRKTRLPSFPDTDSFPWSYASFAERYGKDVIERKGVELKLATPEQVAEVNRMLSMVRLPDNYEEGCLTKARSKTWADMDAEKIEAVLADLNKRIAQ